MVDMRIKRISLMNFRNISSLDIELNHGINIFYGENAQGKTNILEAVSVCATGRSQRTRLDSDLIQFGQQESHIQMLVQKNEYDDRIDVHLKANGRKGIAVNGLPMKRLGELFGTLHAVMFSPEDLQLIKSGPSERRRFMDMELCQLSNVYYHDLQQYYKILKQRNSLLKQVARGRCGRDTFYLWDKQLIDFGSRILVARQRFVSKIEMIASQQHHLMTGGKETLELKYLPNTVADDFESKLESHLERDIILGSTTIGPHKDDLLFLIEGKDAKSFGSQGQQRTVALSAKLAEIELIQQEVGTTPVLLLDDVLSELDESRQVYLLQSITGIQTILTCTGIEDSIRKYMSKTNLYQVKNGVISK